MMKKLHVLDMESLGKLLVGKLRSISKNVMKTYYTEVENETGSAACPDLGLVVSGNEVLCAAVLLLISSLSLLLSSLYCGMHGSLRAGLQLKCNKFPENKLSYLQ
jgi:hypothetical protein